MKKIIIALSFLLLIGCSAVPSKVGKKRAKELAENLTYIKDKETGLCYAVASSRTWRLGLFPSAQKGLGLTQVPCESCRKLLVN